MSLAPPSPSPADDTQNSDTHTPSLCHLSGRILSTAESLTLLPPVSTPPPDSGDLSKHHANPVGACANTGCKGANASSPASIYRAFPVYGHVCRGLSQVSKIGLPSGEKGIQIVAPRLYEMRDDETGEIHQVTHFARVAVFEASQRTNSSKRPLPLFTHGRFFQNLQHTAQLTLSHID